MCVYMCGGHGVQCDMEPLTKHPSLLLPLQGDARPHTKRVSHVACVHCAGVGEVSMGMEDMALVESEEEEDEEEEGEEVLVNPLEEDEDASEEEYQKGLNLLVYAKMGDTQA